MLSHFDLTNDGIVDGRELRTVAYMDYKTPPETSNEILHRSDVNMDEVLDKSELRTAKTLIDAHAQRMAEQWLREHDTDKDGRISETELLQGEYVEHGHSFAQIRGRFREADTNNDSFLNTLELMHVRRLLRVIAINNAAEVMKKYDSDGDHFLSLPEAQILADEIFDLGPDITATILDGVDHRKAKQINELQLVDFLSDLREEAAVTALDKLAVSFTYIFEALDKNGNGMVTFDEIILKYGRQMKKQALKKIFSEVDVNRNANIDPIEFVSMQNLITEWNRQLSSSKDNEKKRRVITVTMPRSPELEALIQARRQQEEKTIYRDRSEPKLVRLVRQAGQQSFDEQMKEFGFGEVSKENATVLDMSSQEMAKLGFQIDSKDDNERNDYKVASEQIPKSQPRVTQSDDDIRLSITTITTPFKQAQTTTTATTTPTTATTDTVVDAINTDTMVAKTTATVSETPMATRASRFEMAASENVYKNQGSTEVVREAMNSSHTRDTVLTEKVTKLDDDEQPTHTKIDDNDFRILRVKDQNGKVTANFRQIERFIEKMREAIHRIIQLEEEGKEKKGNVTLDNARIHHNAKMVEKKDMTMTTEKQNVKKRKNSRKFSKLGDQRRVENNNSAINQTTTKKSVGKVEETRRDRNNVVSTQERNSLETSKATNEHDQNKPGNSQSHVTKSALGETVVKDNNGSLIDDVETKSQTTIDNKGQPKENASISEASVDETEHIDFNVDSKQVNPTNDDRIVSTTQLSTAQYEDVTQVPTAITNTSIAAIISSSTSSTITTATNTTLATAPTTSTTATVSPVNNITTAISSSSPIIAETKLVTTDSRINLKDGVNESQNDDESKTTDSTTLETDNSNDKGIAPIDDATELDENGQRVHSTINDKDFAFLTVKDKEGKVLSNQAIVNFKKFERFIEQMRNDIHHIAKMEAVKKKKPVVVDKDGITAAISKAEPKVNNSMVATNEEHSMMDEALNSSKADDPSNDNQFTIDPLTHGTDDFAIVNVTDKAEENRNQTNAEEDTKTIENSQADKKSELLSHETSGFEVVTATDISHKDKHKKRKNVKSKGAGRKSVSSQSALFIPERTTNEKGELVHSEIENASEFAVVPSTRNFEEDAFGNPILPKDKQGRPIIVNDMDELPPPERLTNEKGEVVHSDIFTDDFTILKTTDRNGNVLTVDEVMGEEKESSEEDDFFAEKKDARANGSPTKHTKLKRQLIYEDEGDTNGSANASQKENNANMREAIDLQKGERKHKDKKDEKKHKEKKDGGKHEEKGADKGRKWKINERKHNEKMNRSLDEHSETDTIGSEKIAEAHQTTMSTNDNVESIEKANRKESNNNDPDENVTEESGKGHEEEEHKNDKHNEKEATHKRHKKKKRKESKIHRLRSFNQTEIELSTHNVTSLVDDVDVDKTNSNHRNQTIGSSYLIESGAEPATGPPTPNFDKLKDDEIRAKARMLLTNRKGTLSGGRAVTRNFEETLAETVPYNDTDFS
ncbi:unnamed protein product [Toxocara canis]|uniref:EF-hand domain-containing protein n=1 Tax=Toxocara canis TaxID=6265 RepID=A0A3P7GQL7_TOXCA|nr:unnamed protein product [Toxocara canis]